MLAIGIRRFRDPYYQGFAAQLSFYFMLSLVPVMLLISQILSLVFKKDLQQAVGWLIDYMGDDKITGTIEKLITGTGSGAMSIVFIVVAIWAASRAQFSLTRIANFTLSGGQYTGKGYIRDRLRAVVTMTLTMITLIFAIVVLMYGDVILSLVFRIIGREEVGILLWAWIRWPIAMVLYFLMISYNYFVLPTEKIKFKSVIPGSLFASIGLLLVTVVYSRYATNIADYNVLYGSLATIVAMMIWFYFLAWVLFLGILVNAVWAETKGDALANSVPW